MEDIILLNQLGLYKEEIKYYPYRKALLKCSLIELPINDDTREIQQILCKKVGAYPDNHTVFVIGDIAIAFSDGIQIGQAKNVVVEKY